MQRQPVMRKGQNAQSVHDLGHISGVWIRGFFVLTAGVLVFALWASLAPLSSATITPGVLVVQNHRQQVEHLEGGIVKEIHVKDSSVVEQGDLLLVLESVAFRSRFAQADSRTTSLLAERARLEAEIAGRDTIIFDEVLQSRRHVPEVNQVMALQTNLLQTRAETRSGRRALLNDRISQFEAQMRALQAKLDADTQRHALIKERLAGLRQLLERGFSSTVQVADVQAQEVALFGSVRETAAQIERVRFQIAETRREIDVQADEFIQTAISDLENVNVELADFESNLEAADDALQRLEVRAPASGTVVGFNVSTVGSVVDGGERLMEIVPLDDQLVIDTIVRPEDVDRVFSGQKVDVRLTAFNQRTTPPVEGIVQTVSADRIVDERTNLAGYSAVIALSRQSILQNLPEEELTPGMPAEVVLINAERSFAEYLLGPIIDLFRRGLRE